MRSTARCTSLALGARSQGEAVVQRKKKRKRGGRLAAIGSHTVRGATARQGADGGGGGSVEQRLRLHADG